MTSEVLTDLPVDSRIWFAEEKRPYTVQARSDRYLICTKPFAAQRTVLYTIIDLQEGVRGPENLIFGMGAETREQCEQMIGRIEGRDRDFESRTEVSWRHRIPTNVSRTESPVTTAR